MNPPVFGIDYNIGYIGFTNTGGGIADAIAYGERWERYKLNCRDVVEPAVTHVFVCTGENAGIEAHLETGVAKFSLLKYSMDPNCKLYFRRPRGWTPELGARIAAAAATPYPQGPFGCSYDMGLIVADSLSDTIVGHSMNALTLGASKRSLCWMLGRKDRRICSQTGAQCLAMQPEYRGKGCLAQPLNTIDPQQLFEDLILFEDGQ